MKGFLLSLLVVFSYCGAAHSADDFYLDFTSGVVFPENTNAQSSSATNNFDHDTGYSFSAALGYSPDIQRGFLYHTRFEAEVAFRIADLNRTGSTGNNSTTLRSSLMANAFYDFKNSTRVTPYIGAGLGITQVITKDVADLGVSDSQSDILAAYQLMTGISYDLVSSSKIGWHFGYRYFSTFSDPEFNHDTTKAEYSYKLNDHIIEAGLRLDF